MRASSLFMALTLGLSTASAGFMPIDAQAQQSPAAKRINRAIELLEQGQPVYYTQLYGGGYEEGVRLAATSADYITYEMENGAFDMSALRAFMQGLADAGRTRSGHRTPAVIVTLPIQGDDPVSMRANAWVAQQAMAAGVHGILLVHAQSVEAVRLFVEAVRYPFMAGVDPKASHRGWGNELYASKIWGLSQTDYLRKADVWPLNPEGEVLLGIKIESPEGLAHAEELTKIPGIAFVEWGPGDQTMNLADHAKMFRLLEKQPDGLPGYARAGKELDPELAAIEQRVRAAAKAANIAFLDMCLDESVIDQIKKGTMICASGNNVAVMEKGRTYTKRKMPW
ncbi:MAG: aldolase/citrate lyase family protein [Sphingobium sp.]